MNLHENIAAFKMMYGKGPKPKSGALSLKGEVDSVGALPMEGNQDGDVYIVGQPSADDKAEYYWFGGTWNYLGETPIDLSNYATVEYVDNNEVGRKYYVDGVAKGETFNYASNASGDGSHAEGQGISTGDFSHAEGRSYGGPLGSGNPTASGVGSHAEGEGKVVASGEASHAEGGFTTASGYCSHAEGSGAQASGGCSHAEGSDAQASGGCSHAEGGFTTASGNCSHAEGRGTIAASTGQHAQGKYNIENSTGKYAFIIGNGTSNSNRSNAFAVDWQGNIYVNNSETGVNVKDLMPKSSIVKLNSMEEFDALTDKTAEFYFIKEG